MHRRRDKSWLYERWNGQKHGMRSKASPNGRIPGSECWSNRRKSSGRCVSRCPSRSRGHNRNRINSMQVLLGRSRCPYRRNAHQVVSILLHARISVFVMRQAEIQRRHMGGRVSIRVCGVRPRTRSQGQKARFVISSRLRKLGNVNRR